MEELERPPIFYRVHTSTGSMKRQLLDEDVERILRYGEPASWEAVTITVHQLGDDASLALRTKEHVCFMEEGLLAHFRSATPEAGKTKRFERMAERQRCAYDVSHVFGIHAAPAAVIRDLPGLGGAGVLVGAIGGMPYFFSSRRREIRESRRSTERGTALAEALLFDFIVGSGQNIATSYVIDSDGLIRTRLHAEAFTYTASKRIIELMSELQLAVSADYWSLLDEGLTSRSKREMLSAALSERLGAPTSIRFFNILADILRRKRVDTLQLAVA